MRPIKFHLVLIFILAIHGFANAQIPKEKHRSAQSGSEMEDMVQTESRPASPEILGEQRPCAGSIYAYHLSEENSPRTEWQVNGGTLIPSNPHKNEIKVRWDNTGTGNIKAIFPLENASVSLPIEVTPLNQCKQEEKTLQPALQAGAVRAFPNPAKRSVSLQFDGITEAGDISIVSQSGKLMFEQPVAPDFPHFERKMEISDYPSGVYIVRFRGPSQFLFTKFTVTK